MKKMILLINIFKKKNMEIKRKMKTKEKNVM